MSTWFAILIAWLMPSILIGIVLLFIWRRRSNSARPNTLDGASGTAELTSGATKSP
jgi:hypothetical protein